LEEDVLQDIVSEVFVAHQVADQQQEQGAVPLDQDFERALLADVRLFDQDVIRQVRILPV
jgi:hypothetical protein